MILVGDIGGTHSRLALFTTTPDGDAVVNAQYSSRAFESFTALLHRFRADHPDLLPNRCALAVAGPVSDGRCRATNLPWTLDVAEIAQTLGLGANAVTLLNDVEAAALGLAAIPAECFVVLQAGDPQARGNRALIAPGTGLGEAMLYWDGVRHRAFATEGGHCDFAPRNVLEAELLRHATHRYPGHVSVERLLAGPGIALIHEFLVARSGDPAIWTPPACGDASAAISARALARKDELCERALALYAALLGAEAGNLALKAMATGGVTITGGVAPRILPALTDGVVRDNFLAKGRFRNLLERIPLSLCLDERAPLLGALRRARELI